MRITINQPAMLGDLLFIEPIVKHLTDQGNTVIWPVKDQYAWLKDYMPYNILKQSECNINYEDIEMRPDYIPLRFSTPLFRGTDPHSGQFHEHFMMDKYRLLELPLDLWKTLSWNRNHEKELQLFNQLDLQIGQDFTLVNMYFKDIYEPQPEMAETNWGDNVVFMRPIPGFTLLDWAMVVLHASAIHTVETSLLYMIEALPVKAELHMYCRWPYDSSLNGVKNFISDRWIRHEKN